MSLEHVASYFCGEGEQKEIIHDKHPDTLTLSLSLFYTPVIARRGLK